MGKTMAKVKGPLFSLSASGEFNGMMEFRTVGSGTVAAGVKSRVPPRSPAQAAQTARFSRAVGGWRTLTLEQRNAWRTAGPAHGMTGYQLYISEYQTQGIQPPGQPQIP
jgi:hypothetical protein